ncbi:MAG: HD domain-containing protein [Acidisphaera sp.]|nr:HD domain-containing protein [Acidisphaera sp.]
MLPSEQGQKLLALWLEFEAAETPSARFAKALDRLQPLFLNTLAGGGTWTENSVTEQQVLERYGPTIERGSPELWQEARKLVRQYFGDATTSETPPGRLDHLALPTADVAGE